VSWKKESLGCIAAATAAGIKAAAAVKRLPDDPLDKVARYENVHKAHGEAPVVKPKQPRPGAKRRNRRTLLLLRLSLLQLPLLVNQIFIRACSPRSI